MRPVPGLERFYSVTDDGRVWSHRLSRWLNPSRHSRGYLEVRITTDAGKKNVLVHRLVAMAWVVNPLPRTYQCINHINGIKTDNRSSNLEWCDRATNNAHARLTGLNKPAESHREAARRMGLATRRLSEQQVRELRDRKNSGESVTALAKEFGIPRTTASSAIHGHNYATII